MSLLASVLDARRRRDGATRAQRGDEGFIMLESILAISMITVLMGALASFTLNAVSGSSELRARQAAAQLATSAMATVASVQATDLIAGQNVTSFASAPAAVQPWLSAMDPISTVPTGTIPTVPTPPTIPIEPVKQTLNSITYSVTTYLGTCAMRALPIVQGATDTTPQGECVRAGTGTSQLRAVVAVTWSGRGCRSRSTPCTYVTATLINTDADPVFNLNRANPPSKPVVESPGDQKSTVGGAVSLQLSAKPGTGLSPFTWQVTTGALPTGLTLQADGLVTGIPSATVSATPLTVTVSDAFGRTASQSFTWSVLDAPTIFTPPTQVVTVGRPLGGTIPSTCPNGPCVFSLAGAPAGFVIDASTGAISGSPTTPGTSSVTVTVTDAAGVSAATAPFTVQVFAAPTIGAVGTVSSTVGVPTNVEVPYTCGFAPCTITLAGSVPGLGLSTTAGRTGSNTTTSLTVPVGSGRVYIGGTVAASAVPSGTSRSYTVTATIADSGGAAVSSSGTWTANLNPLVNFAVGRPATQSSTAFDGAPGRAVDGNTDGVYNNGSVTHTFDQTQQPWWQVDLGAASTIRTVVLFNRTDCCAERLSNGTVLLSTTDMTGRTYAQLQADPAVTKLAFGTLANPSLSLAAGDVRARYVRVQLAGSTPLSLAEVQVLGPNLALGKTATQSSNYDGLLAPRAVDGNTDGVAPNGSTTHTQATSQPWWQVDLGGSSTVNAVTVWNRTDCCTDRLNNAVVFVSSTDMTGRSYNQLVADGSVTKVSLGANPGTRTTVPVAGVSARYVRIQLPGTSGGEILSLAEVQVNGTGP